LKALYNADLANGLGNLASRVTRLCEKAAYGRYAHQGVPPAPEGYHEAFEGYRFDHALAALGNVVTQINRDIEIAKPWECLNDDIQKLIPKLTEWLDALHGIAHWIQPVLPGTAKRILEGLNADRISAFQPLFPRLR
jgi:methionyl-tRNA synthetase